MLAIRSRFSQCCLLSGVLLSSGNAGAQTPDRPPSITALEAQGVKFIQEFEAGKNVRAFAGEVSGQPVAVYVLPDGNAIAGTRLDERGEPLDQATLEKLVAGPIDEKAWARLEKSTWVPDGNQNAPRIIYMFSDANCPYCHQFAKAARPWIKAGKIQLRHLLVGVIKQDSAAKAAAILGAPDRTAALQENERTYGKGGIKPVQSIPAQIRQIIDANQTLMIDMGFRGTPGIAFRDADGQIQKYNGMPQKGALAEVLGPR